MALALTWGGFADTDVDFGEVAGADHTVACRFLLQFPHAYGGPMLAVDGAGEYVVGQADFIEGGRRPALEVRIGPQRIVHPLTEAGTAWHHLALVRSDGAAGPAVQLYVDGRRAGRPVAVGRVRLPSGRLRLGKTRFDPQLDGGGAQLYGLLDDVAVFPRALSPDEVARLAAAGHLSGAEPGLLAGYTFGREPAGGLTPALRRPLWRTPGATIRRVSEGRDAAADSARFPLALTSHMRLPIPAGEAWEVIQGVDDPAGSHNGYAAFCWDLVLAGKPQSDSDGARFLAAAGGRVDAVQEDQDTGGQSNLVSVQQAPLEFCDYLHLERDSAVVAPGARVGAGQHLADVGDTGAGRGAFHLHIATTNLGEANRGRGGAFVTIPAPFSDYQASDDRGKSWRPVLRGLPRAGQWVRQRPSYE